MKFFFFLKVAFRLTSLLRRDIDFVKILIQIVLLCAVAGNSGVNPLELLAAGQYHWLMSVVDCMQDVLNTIQ